MCPDLGRNLSHRKFAGQFPTQSTGAMKPDQIWQLTKAELNIKNNNSGCRRHINLIPTPSNHIFNIHSDKNMKVDIYNVEKSATEQKLVTVGWTISVSPTVYINKIS